MNAFFRVPDSPTFAFDLRNRFALVAKNPGNLFQGFTEGLERAQPCAHCGAYHKWRNLNVK